MSIIVSYRCFKALKSIGILYSDFKEFSLFNCHETHLIDGEGNMIESKSPYLPNECYGICDRQELWGILYKKCLKLETIKIHLGETFTDLDIE